MLTSTVVAAVAAVAITIAYTEAKKQIDFIAANTPNGYER